jgi:peptidoglycan/xylan/chitin deacetylase (PgdA/CDA1 family)
LRRHRFTILSLDDLLKRVEAGQPLYKTVVFTVDDGYADFSDLGMAVFREFDCPVTVFLTTGFLDGACWLWWDAVRYLVDSTQREDFQLEQAGTSWQYGWNSSAERSAAVLDLVNRMKAVSEEAKQQLIAQMVTRLEVELPSKPTTEFAPLRWNDVRHCGQSGASFGPHSVTHPILTRVNDGQAAREIEESWRRVRAEAAHAAIPVFCYPNGTADSFSEREQQLVRNAGLKAAMTTLPGYASRHLFRSRQPEGRYAVPRLPYVQEDETFLYMASGLDRAKRALAAWKPGPVLRARSE